MSNLVITTDSPSDVVPEKAKEYGIGISPLHVNLDGKDYKDGEITNEFILQTYQEKKVLPNTSAVSIAEYLDFFGAYLAEGKTVIHIAFSSGCSCTYQNACLAAEELKGKGTVHVIDSKALSILFMGDRPRNDLFTRYSSSIALKNSSYRLPGFFCAFLSR